MPNTKLRSAPQDIQYDSRRKETIIFFRGKRIVLSGYDTEAKGREAAEEYFSANAKSFSQGCNSFLVADSLRMKENIEHH